jgi:hypothetical protein
VARHREAFQGLGVQDITEFDSVFCSLGEKKKEKEKWPGTFFPGPEARHTLLTVLGGIFAAVRCN